MITIVSCYLLVSLLVEICLEDRCKPSVFKKDIMYVGKCFECNSPCWSLWRIGKTVKHSCWSPNIYNALNETMCISSIQHMTQKHDMFFECFRYLAGTPCYIANDHTYVHFFTSPPTQRICDATWRDYNKPRKSFDAKFIVF